MSEYSSPGAEERRLGFWGYGGGVGVGGGEKVKLQKGAETGEWSLVSGNTRKSWSLVSENRRVFSGQ